MTYHSTINESNMTKKHYPEVSGNPDFPKIEENIISLWKKEGVFEKSVSEKAASKDGKNNEFVFYDGPPFANGLPHYGHLLTGYVKDIFARYQTMKGKRVERRFGWDCHGLPAEMGAEKELGISGRFEIEKFGIDKFNDACRTSVMKYTKEWEQYVSRQARWVDFENDYKTMDKGYMESVLWAFKQLWDKGLVYESMRVMPYSWACETPLSNFETRMDNSYRERTDKAITVAFELDEKPAGAPDADKYYLCAWTTTPWTLPSNLALAVNSEIPYRAFKKDGALYIASQMWIAQNKEKFEEQGYQFTSLENDSGLTDRSFSVSGESLVGLTYKPLFPYFAFKKSEGAFKILAADFVLEGDGTGVVHLAPGFGEDDFAVCKEAGIPLVCPVDNAGRYTDQIEDVTKENYPDLPPLSLKGLNVIADKNKSESEPYNPKQLETNGLANLRIIKWLNESKKLIAHGDYKHNYPHCWRTDTPLIYKAVPSWYVEVTKFKDRMVELNQEINWIPNHVKDGQFGKWLENARDWSISRNRYWGAPIPVWKSDNPKSKNPILAFGSIAELEAFFGEKIEDLHRPFIDSLKKADDDEQPDSPRYFYKRVSDVFDCWFESGSMPYAQVHYPFENKDWFETHFPADFIVEYVAQTRGWFYTLMVLSTALFDRPPFKNVICHGVVMSNEKDAEGKFHKLSKRLRNYPDPTEVFDKYGADALRWFMVSSSIMHGSELYIDREGKFIHDTIRLYIKPIWNAYNFFTLYANADGLSAEYKTSSNNLMDKYILAKCRTAVEAIEKAMDAYDTPPAYTAIEQFFEVLNNWYIRRSKERFWKSEKDEDKQAAYDTLYTVLHIMCRAMSPLLPIITEEIWQGLNGDGVSIHLTDFPNVSEIKGEVQLISDMDRVRDVCNAALAIRSAENIRVRQPLSSLTVVASGASNIAAYKEIIEEEINAKEVLFSDKVTDFADYKLKINFPILGKRLPTKVKDIIAASKQNQWKQVSGTIEIAGEALLPEEFSLQLEPKNKQGAQALSTNDALVILDLNITDELRIEGVYRDLVRLVQQSRKEADLNIVDRIALSIETANEDIKVAVGRFSRDIAEQTLAVFVSVGDASVLANFVGIVDAKSLTYRFEQKLEGENVVIAFKVIGPCVDGAREESEEEQNQEKPEPMRSY